MVHTTRVTPSRHYALAALSAGAAAIHFGLAPAHFAESTALGLGFVLTAWGQLALAVLLLARPSRSALVAGAAGNAIVLGAWLLSRTVGVWFVHQGVPEALGFVDLTAAVLEAAFILGAVAVWLGYRPAGTTRVRPAGAVAIAGALALTTVALASPAAEHEHDEGVDHNQDIELATTADGHEHEHTGSADQPATEAATATGPHHHAACTEPVTTSEQATADAFIVASDTTVAKYADFAVAQAEGWKPITPENSSLVHYGLIDRMQDGRVLDPTAPESLIYVFGPNRTPYFLGAMYLMEGSGEPPQPGGCAMTWHNHENLCIAAGREMVGVVQPDGSCPEGSENVATTYMLHAWSIPMPGGPFSEIDPQAVRQAVIDAYT